MEKNSSIEKILAALQERAKELNCLYKVEELLNNTERDNDYIYSSIVRVLPPGWQYPDVCVAKLTINDKSFSSPDFKETEWVQESEIIVQGSRVGTLKVFYLEEKPEFDEGPFLKEERKLIDTIAERIGGFILHNKLKNVFPRMAAYNRQGRER